MAAALPDWMMLERFVFCRESLLDSEAAPFIKADGTSSHGGSFSVAFLVLQPPGISRLYLQWPGGPKGGSQCVLVAAHRNLVLFRLTPDPVITRKAPFVDYRQDHFICGAQFSPSQRSLLLRKIPKCDQPALVDWRDGEKLNLRRSNDEWGKIEAELCVLRSKVSNRLHEWKSEKWLPIQYEGHERSDLDSWRTDRVVPFNKFLCWVNYGGGGILFCEVFKQKPNIFYLRLPIIAPRLHQCSLRFQEASRAVGVTKGSMGCDELRFVDVVCKDGNIIDPLGYGDNEGFTITYYALRITQSGGMEWDMLFFIRCYELWSINPQLPHELLKHPVVSMEDPNVVYFLMSERLEHVDKVSVVTLDMCTKKLLSIHPYINGKEDLLGKDADMVRRNATFLQTFLPSELPKFLKSHQLK
ncbi:hypothetical protein CFC21_022850 [Triticum aestivum]|uniref:DUF1618 domain-containing protein n=3 Tax=Triticum TaxID=4564 RepID=A0A9R1RKF4_TRITD|nr:uncharacterized protein LOC123044505 isoform X2 [Triticum aestivum]KAF7007979.1 hypothetical protein CFC21_022850 [Triticum aestivum]VAH44661.1 unnamed protein product [Triticum turgidum subsp. durum]